MNLMQARRGRWAVAAMFLVNGFIMGSWAPQIPLLLPRHAISEAVLGLLILGLGLGAVGAMAFSGGLIARFGSARVARGFALACSTTLPLVVLAPSVPLLALAMGLMGAVIGCMDVAMNANAVEVERRLDRAVMSSSHGFWSLGGFAGGGLGGLVIARAGSEVQAFGVGAVCLGIVLVAGRFLVSEVPVVREATPGTGRPGNGWPRGVAIWVIGAMALFSMVPEGAVLDWAALYLGQEMETGLATSGLAFAAFSGAMAVMRFLGDGLRNRFGAVATLRVSGGVAAAGLLAASLAPGLAWAIAGFGLAGLGIANMVPIALSAAGNQPGARSGSGIAAVTMMGYSGILVAPSAIGLVAETTGFRPIYAVLAILLLVVGAQARRVAAADRG